MEELEQASGAAFELRFTSLMTIHHTLAIERARIAVRRGRHAQLCGLARDIFRAQETEITQFRSGRQWTARVVRRLTTAD